jgi:hypothetical protein
MPLDLSKLIEELSQAPAVALIFFLLSIYCVTTAIGFSPGLPQIGKFSLPPPNITIGKILYGALGVISLALALYLTFKVFPLYTTTVEEKFIDAGTDAAGMYAKQIVSDGEDVYILMDSGNIFRVAQSRLQLIDNGTGTQQIAPAGGVIYILKNNGYIWAGQWLSANPTQYNFIQKDWGTGTKQIVAVGETLYVLKNNGEIWKYSTRPDEYGTVRDDFVKIYIGTDTQEISSSGALLYILKKDGSIWQYAPVQPKDSGPFQEVYKGRDAVSIKADGKALYFIKQDGSAWKYGEDKLTHIDTGNHDAKKIDAQYGLVYILTTEQTIWKYNSQNNTSRQIDKAHNDNETMAAYGPDIFVIKHHGGGVWRYNEGLMKR